MRSCLVALCRLLLRIFFRQIEVVGRHHVPDQGSVIFVLNHPSGLVDPLFILCLSKRRVSFLAKEPLFRMPLIGLFVRAFECLPVYRSRDGADPQKNRAMMESAVRLLSRGNALALFPEGTSHSDPTLKPFKTGAARIALSAASHTRASVWLVPAALYYEQKDTFRSRAVLAFGPPLCAAPLQLDETGQPPREESQALTAALQAALEDIMPTAETAEGLVLAEHAERILRAAARTEETGRIGLSVRMTTRRKLIDAYGDLLAGHRTEVDQVIAEVRGLAGAFERLGLSVDAQANPAARRTLRTFGLWFWFLLLLPVGLLGTAVHYPTYRVIRFLAFRYAGEETDVLATVKLVGGLLLYPLTWLALAAATQWRMESPYGLLAFLAGPPVAWISLRFHEIASTLRRRQRQKSVLARVPSRGELEEARKRVATHILDLLELASSGSRRQPVASQSAPGEEVGSEVR